MPDIQENYILGENTHTNNINKTEQPTNQPNKPYLNPMEHLYSYLNPG